MWAREEQEYLCVGHSKHERHHLQQEGGEREIHIFLGRERESFEHARVLQRRGKSHPRLILVWGKLQLEDLGLWWSVGEGGERDAFSSFHERCEKASCESENEKSE